MTVKGISAAKSGSNDEFDYGENDLFAMIAFSYRMTGQPFMIPYATL